MLKIIAASLLTSNLILLAAAMAPSPAAARGPEQKAELIVNRGRIFTGKYKDGTPSLKGGAPVFEESMAIAQGKIIFVGSARDAAAYRGPQTRLYDLGGKLVLPGFHDCHVHLCESGLERRGCQLFGAKSKADALARLKSFAKKHHGNNNNWIMASGLPLPAVQRSPLTSFDIDSVESHRPVVIYSEDAHSLWLNSKAMELAHIDASTKTPETGVIERDRDGKPNGALREEAMELIESALPIPPLAERTSALREAVLLANSLGITSIQDAHTKEEFLEAYRDLADKQQLNLKVVAALHVGKNFRDQDFDHLVELREKYTGGNLKATSAKIFADGVIETETAALLDPYLLAPSTGDRQAEENRGTLNYPADELERIVKALDKRGFQVHIHAIGDRAVRVALDALAAAREANADKLDYEKHRHQIAHLELIQKADRSRFKALGVVANFQPYWAFNDPYMLELTAPVLGQERMQLIYPIKSIVKSGAHLAAGSDWSVSTLNPLRAMQVAITRQEPGQPEAKPLLKDERVSLAEILAAYTTGGAYANHSEDRTGTLEVGKDADFIALDRNIFTLNPQKLSQARVLKTFVSGKLVFDRSLARDRAVSE